jgi:hypothetical protein
MVNDINTKQTKFSRWFEENYKRLKKVREEEGKLNQTMMHFNNTQQQHIQEIK